MTSLSLFAGRTVFSQMIGFDLAMMKEGLDGGSGMHYSLKNLAHYSSH